MEVLDRIEKLRKEKGWSINYLAMESGLTQSTLNNLYSRNTEPKISTLRAICGAFGITLSDFFKEEENDDELIRKVKALSQDNKKALLQLLNSMK
ncbi:MAG: helix-turn-helix transcriptional regulator [Candidatus Borkfalkiaceae bacterium]|nr:helix-turn-helix transcriptional regulator [Christensenellaceae bacterium]